MPSSFVTGPRVVASDGVELATYDLGGEGPALLLSHATGFHGRVWLPLVTHLRDRFHCYSYDIRAHGHSGSSPDGRYSWTLLAGDVAAVLRGLGLERPLAIGHSGGGASVIMAEELAPGTFRGLYCYEPVVPPFDERQALELMALREGGNPMSAAARRRREVFPSREAAAANYRGKAPFDTWDPAALDAYVDGGFEDLDDGTVRLWCRADNEARFYEMALFDSAFFQLHKVACPVALVCGAGDAHFGPDALAAMAERLADASIEVMPELGHLGPMEQPAVVAASIRRAFSGA